MRILSDQATPVGIRAHLRGHTVRTAAQEGWAELRNGDLLTAAEQAGFDLLLTTDKNMSYQQNLKGRKMAIVVVSSNNWDFVKAHIAGIMIAIDAVTPGSYTEVQIPVW